MNSSTVADKPLASLSLDLDNKWTYLRTHGDPRWELSPTYLPTVVPTILEFLKARSLKITFFVVGQDVRNPLHADLFKALVADGHELASHSLNHLPWLHLLTRDEIDEELRSTEDVIQETCGVSVNGFRGPGFSLSKQHLAALANRGYYYDASSFPNLLNPLARAYFFAKSRLTPEEKAQRKGLFGTYRDALRPLKPFRWDLGENGLLEIPVTTMPVFRVPIHFSYLIYLATYSKWVARWYFRMALFMCRCTRTQPSLLLHPLDFLGPEDEKDLDFFPGMSVSRSDKLDLLNVFLRDLSGHFRIVTMGEHAQAAHAETQSAKRLDPAQTLSD